MAQTFELTRRGILTLASGALAQSCFRLYAGDADFWNKKDPSQWSSEEIDKLKTKSPWAKTVSITMRQSGSGGNGGGAGYPGGGGMGGGGMGGGGMGRGRRGGMGAPAGVEYHGEVRWLSAKPIQAALKSPVPEGMANAYVISVSGIPIVTGDRPRSSDTNSDDTGANGLSKDVLDRIRDLTYLEPKGKSPEQPNTVQQGSAGFETNVLLFAFPHEGLHLTPEDKEVSFTTQLGRLEVKTKFNLKEMMYHKELAL
ncbi:MAG TPA: hypothetical protein VMR62_36485 [Bryobacteraceae bacterium]|jgi:hypothetical protein|nr:hypothetical protein [Bryobacteraceae bacterium]